MSHTSPLLFARKYTDSLLAEIPDEQWFTMPGGITHVAWHVGHLASAELRLCLIRIRGPLRMPCSPSHSHKRTAFAKQRPTASSGHRGTN